MRKVQLVGMLAAGFLATGPAHALNLEGPELDFYYQQTEASPCVIGGSNCQNPDGFLYTLNGPGGGGSLDNVMSPIYEAAAIASIVADMSNVTIGIDLNENNGPQDVYFFKIFGCSGADCTPATLIDEYNPGSDDDQSAALGVANNGVGYSDYLFTNVDLTGFERIRFQSKWFNNDGADRWFLVGCDPEEEECGSDTPPVPEPSSMLLMGGGLLGLAWWRKRKVS